MHDRELSTELIEDAIANADEVNRQGERLIAVREQLIGPRLQVVYVERAGINGLEAHVITAYPIGRRRRR